jgi:hypothetical protein
MQEATVGANLFAIVENGFIRDYPEQEQHRE